MKSIELGNKVKCMVTGFTGIAVSKVYYINGCIQYGVKGNVKKDGDMPSTEYIDEQQIEVVDIGIAIEPKPTGGPQADAPRY